MFPRENPPSITMVNWLRDFTRMILPFTQDLRLLRITRRSVGKLCCMPAWAFPGLWSMSIKWRKTGIGNILGQGKVQDKLRRIFKGKVILKLGISPGLKRDSHTKGSQVHPRVAMIEILSLELRETMK